MLNDGQRVYLRCGFLGGAAASAMIAATTPALAQVPILEGDTDVVVVTAQRRAENVQDVPIQITVFTEQAILDAGVNSSQDFVNLTSNVTLDDSFTYLNTFVSIRGLAQINNADSPLAVVVDGVQQNNQRQFKMNLVDLEQIEVLKGPQGALYGRNASGGAVVITTKQPTNEFEGFASASYASGNRVETVGSVSGPIVEDRVLFRVAGSYIRDDGRIDNDFLGEKVDFVDYDYLVRGKLTVLATDWLTFDARVMYNEFEAGSIYDSFVPSGDANDFQPPTNSLLGESEGEIFEATFKWDADFGFATLTGITGYTNLNTTSRGDLDFSNATNNPLGAFGGAGQLGQVFSFNTDLTSQELRLASRDDQPFRWIIGAYYLDTDVEFPAALFSDAGGGFEQANDPNLVFFRQDFVEDRDAWSVFAQADWDLNDRLSVGAAVRYDEDRREQADQLSSGVRVATFDSFQPRFTLSYDVSDNGMLYATYARGFRSGGFNAPGLPEFRSEIVDTIEGGFKTSWWEGRAVFNGAFYYSFVDDFQFFFLDVLTGQNIANIDDVHIYGFEFEARARLMEGLDVFAAVGTSDTEIKESTLFPGSIGNETPKSTDYTANIGAQYRRPVSNDLFAFLRVDYERRGDRTWQVDNVDIQEPVDLVNFRLGLEANRLGVYVFGENVFDVEYFTDFNPNEFSGLGYDIGFLGQPAKYGVEVRGRF